MDFLRSKQSGVQHDFTGTLANSPDVFILDEVAKHGLNSTISCLSYDPLQSLLAVGTHAHGTTSGSVHIFGQSRVHATFPLSRHASVKHLRLCDSKAVCIDSKNELTVFNLELPGELGVEYSPPGIATALETDHCLDWAFLGLQNGEVVAYDLDRGTLAPWRVKNFWRDHVSVDKQQKISRTLPVVGVQLHPKDVGTLLIAYSEGVVVYSFKQNAVVHWLQLELHPGAPGADVDLAAIRTLRRPRVVEARWHPTGTFVLTAHDDGVLAVWNARDGALVTARTLDEADVHIPHSASLDFLDAPIIRQPVFKVAWCSTSNPDDTSLLIAGAGNMMAAAKGLTMMDLGPTPNMLTSSATVVSSHFSSPRRIRLLPTPAGVDVVDFCVLPRSSAHYSGTHDPIAVIALLASGELTTLRWPDGSPLRTAGMLPVELGLCHGFVEKVYWAQVGRVKWMGMAEQWEKRETPEVLVGGVGAVRPLRRHENRTIALAVNARGTVMMWDLGHADKVENEDVIELDISTVLQRSVDLEVASMAVAGATGEVAVGMETGEVVVYRWDKNKAFGWSREGEAMMATSRSESEIADSVTDVRMRADPRLKEGLLPLCLLDQKCGSPVAMEFSDVGFLAVAYQTGHLCVLDMRGPAVIYHQSLTTLSKAEKRSSFRKSVQQPVAREKVTALSFGVVTLDGNEFSTLCLFVGTTSSRILTFSLLPSPNAPTFTCTATGTTAAAPDDGPLLHIHPLNAETGVTAAATPAAVGGLREGEKTPGALVTVSTHTIRVFRPPAAKGAHKTMAPTDAAVAANVVTLDTYGTCVVVLLRTGHLRAFSLPGLKDFATLDTSSFFDVPRLPNSARILPSAHVAGWTGEHQVGLAYIFGKGARIADVATDMLYNPELPPVSRPTISSLQWLAGTQYLSTQDLDIIIGGEDRPMSVKQREMETQMRMEARVQQRQQQGDGGTQGEGQGGLFAGMVNGLRERTEKLTMTTESIDRLGESSASFAEDVGKYVKQQQRKALIGGVMGKWF